MARKNTKKRTHLNRYTYIPELLYMLEKGSLPLADPQNWSDKTDCRLLEEYAGDEKEVRSLCFFRDGEKNHYWELYAKHGCKIEFDKEKLLSKIPKSIRYGNVHHIKRCDLKKESKEKLPFIKQWRYRNEKEFRFVWKGSEKEAKEISLPINMESVIRIIISGDIGKNLFANLKNIISKICKDKNIGKITVSHSNLFENEDFIIKTAGTKKLKKHL